MSVLLFILGCSTRKQFIKNDTFCEFDQTILENEKFFLINELHSTKRDSLNKYGYLDMENNEKYLVKIFDYRKQDSLITKIVLNKKTNIIKTLIYHKNDGYLFVSDFTYEIGDIPIGKANFYNRFGEITKVEDDEIPDKYPICFKEAIHLVERKIGKKDSVFGIDRAKALRKNDTLYYWNIYVDEVNNKPSRTIWIYDVDAATGRIIKKRRSVRAQGW